MMAIDLFDGGVDEMDLLLECISGMHLTIGNREHSVEL
jgi:hypothetical protein